MSVVIVGRFLGLLIVSLFVLLHGAAQDLASDDFMREGDSFLRDGRFDDSVDAYSSAIKVDPSSKVAYTKRATAYSRIGQIGSAIQDLTAALSIEPSSVATRMFRADMYLRSCIFDSAFKDYQAVLDLKPGNDAALQGQEKVTTGRAHLETAKALVESDDYKAADEALSRLKKVATDCPEARLLAARMSFAEGNYAQCSWETRRMLKSEPGNVQALILRGDSLYHLEEFDTAKRHYGEVLTNYDPDNSEARERFKKVKKINTELQSVREMVRLRKWKSAEGVLTGLLEALEKSHVNLRREVIGSLGRARFHLGRDPALALEALEEALEGEFDEDVLMAKVEVLLKLEKFEQAVEVLDGALREHGKTQRMMELKARAVQQLKQSKMKDYYKTLGVPRDVDDASLKKAFRQLALKYHPDKVDGDKEQAEANFAEISEAYEVLSDPEKKRLYELGEDPFKDAPQHQHGGFGGFRFQQGTQFHFTYG